ncbi:MAG: GEVED domain-containing protein [Rhodopirellula sp. JB044]|uniref:GEVED domain-containing protein n=1 Tax=Rhodopirellula sp. JB044 TaxID=3342844 RepID=UPI00370AC1BB
MTIGKPGKDFSGRRFRNNLANRLGLGGDESTQRRRGKRSLSVRERRARIERRLHSQPLEARQLLAGPELVGIQPNSGELIRGGTSIENSSLFGTEVLQTAPNELRFRFDSNSAIDVDTLLNPATANDDTLSPLGLSITRAGSDQRFETATALTDFGTSVNASESRRIEVEFRAAAPGVSGNGTTVRVVEASVAGSAAPVVISSVDPDLKTIDITFNTNAPRAATVSDLLDTLENHPTANQVVTAYSVHGLTTTAIDQYVPTGGFEFNLDGANTARVTTDLGLGDTTQVRFLANQSGTSGRDISISITPANLGSSSTPLVSVTNNVINIRINSNSSAQTTVGELIAAVNGNPTAANLVTASLQRGASTGEIPTTFTTVSAANPSGLALAGASDTVVPAGYVGIGDTANEVVFRFAEPLPDDAYQIEIYGEGERALLNTDGEAFNDGVDFAVQFEINSPPQVLAVVPEPVSKLDDGRLISEPNVIEVYFTGDVNDSVLIEDYYTAVFTRDSVTGGDDVEIKPIDVVALDGRSDAVRVVFNSPFSRTPDPDNPGDSIEGAVRFRVGNDTSLPMEPVVTAVTEAESGDSIFANPSSPTEEPGPMILTGFNGTNLDQATAIRLTGGSIDTPIGQILQFPGGTDYEGVQDIRPDDPTGNDRVVPLGIWRTEGDTTDGISTIYYNFPDEWRGEDFGTQSIDLDETYSNAITEQQKQRVREVAALFSEYLGVQFIEVGQDAAAAISDPSFAGEAGPVYSIGVGELASTFDGTTAAVNSAAGGVTVANRALDDQGNTFLPFDFDTLAVNGNQLIVLDGQDFDQSTDDFTGGEFFRGVFLGIGQLLGYGYADHLPQPITQSTESVLDPDTSAAENPTTTADLVDLNEASYPSPADIVNGQFLYRPESNDIDLYQFTLANAGTLNVSTIAERLSSSSTLDTMLRLYKIEGGVPIEIAANDDYFSNDSMIEIEVESGTYVVGVSASGNDQYDPIISGTGIGGVSEGDYEVSMTFTPRAVNSSITDGVNILDGDADGEEGGLFQYWFEPNDANNTVYVDNSGTTSGTGTLGSISNPFTTLSQAFSSVEARRGTDNPVEVVRVVGSDDDSTSPTYRIGTTQLGSALTNGEVTTVDVPKDVNLILDAGVRFEMSGSRIGVGSTSAAVDRSGSSIQVLGTPDNPVELVGFGTNPQAGTWGGIEIRGDIDFADDSRTNMEENGIFLNHIQYADIQHAGGQVREGGELRRVSAVELAESRATIINSMISQSGDAAIAATPNTFEETRFDEARFQNEVNATTGATEYFTSDFVRIGPHIRGNTITDNTYNGLLIRINTPAGGSTETLDINARFDDTDIVHILIENLLIEGNPGGPVSLNDSPSLLLTQTNPVVNTPTQDNGDIPQGDYVYRMTYVTRDGFESAASDVSQTVSLTATGAITLSNLPTVVSGAGYTGRRLYRAEVLGTDVNGLPIYSDFMRVGRLNTSSTTFTDTVAVGDTMLDPSLLGVGSLALAGRLDPGLTIDPGTILKMNDARIDVTFGARLYAEGTDTAPVVLTSLNDRRYGSGGTFNTNGLLQDSTPGAISSGEAGDWAGIYAAFGADVSIDHGVIAGGGGVSRVEGGFASFNVIEAHQSNLRVANTRFENNDDGRSAVNDSSDPTDPLAERVGRVNNASGTIFVRGSQPIIVGNTFIDGSGPTLTFDVNSFTWQEQTDYGRSTGALDALEVRGNSGPLIQDNRIETDFGLAGMEIRGGEVATEVVWDDTDIVHIVRDTIEVPNQHIYGGLRLESDARASLVVKFDTLGDTPEQTLFFTGINTDVDPADLPTPGDVDFVSDGSLGEAGEFTSVTADDTATLDYTVTAGDDFIEVQIIEPVGATVADNTFNGFQISAEFDLGAFDNATLDIGDTTLNGFDSDRVTVIDGNLFLNLAGLTFEPNDVIRIDTGTLFPVSDVEFESDALLRQQAGIIVGGNAYTAEDELNGKADRIGGSLQVIGQPDFPVILTSLADDSVGAGFTPAGFANLDTDGENIDPTAGGWDGIVIREAASDSNASITSENEPSNVGQSDTNAIASQAQFLGEIAPDRASGDENRRLGLIVDGELSSSSDVDVYSFVAEAGTQVWLDIDRTDLSVDTVIELVNANGQTLVLSDDAMQEAALIEELLSLDAADPANDARREELTELISSRTGRGTQALDIDSIFGLATGQIDAGAGIAAFQDNYSINSRDAGMRVILPGVVGQTTLYHVRVRSALSTSSKENLTSDAKNPMVVGDTSNVFDNESTTDQDGGLRLGLTQGAYQLQIRIEESDVSPGTQIRYSDVMYADNGVQVIGGPMHSPLTGDDFETAGDNDTFANAQRLGLYDTQFTGDPALDAGTVVQPDGSILVSRDTATEDRVDVELNNGAGPLSSDRLAKNVSGYIDGIDDVDWFEFEIEYQQLTRDAAAMYLATVFDIDYADGASRADLSLYVFDAAGNLVLIGGDSNIADDITSAGGTTTSDLERGSYGTADPYIGSAELPEGTYYVAISNKYQAPAQLDQFTSRTPTNPLIRLEPVDSTRRIAEEGFENFGNPSTYSQVAEGPVVPVLFDNDSIIEYTLDDVLLYVNTGSDLYLVNPFTGETYAELGEFGTTIRDIAFTANGELFGYTIPEELDDGSYTYARINTVDATITPLENTGIETSHDLEIEEDAVQVLDEDSDDGLIVEGITIRDRSGEETGFFVADRPIVRQGLTSGFNFNRQGYTTNILSAFAEETGEATGPEFDLTLFNAGAGTNIREVGQIDTSEDPDDGQPDDANVIGVYSATAINSAGVAVPQLFDGDNFTVTNGTQFVTFELNQGYTLISSNPASIANGTTLSITLPGRTPVVFELTNAQDPTTPGNVIVNIDRTASNTVFIEQLAAAIRAEAPDIPISFEGTQLAFPTATAVALTPPNANPTTGLTLSGSNLVQTGNVPITLLPTDSAETIANRIVQAIATQNASGTLTTVIGTSLGHAVQVTGVVVSANSAGGNLRLGGFANGGSITGIEMVGNALYAVSDAGGLYFVSAGSLNGNGNNDVGQYVASSTDLIGIQFSGLRTGPNSLRDDQGREILFGITNSGEIHAFNLEGELLPVFAGGRTSINTGIFGAQGLDFATLDFNLWHVTDARDTDEGHGINDAFHGARPDQGDANNSLVFNYTAGAFNDTNYTDGEEPVQGLGSPNQNVRQDGQDVEGTYNFPGGAHGSVQSNAFSLAGYSADDLPTMYFNYFLETDGVDEETVDDTNLFGEDQDSLRVYVVDQNGVEHLVATNNELRRDLFNDDEFDDPAEFGIYDDDIDVDVQQLYDNTGTWRQARVPLSEFAGQSGLSLRIEFATAGTTSTLTNEIRTVAANELIDGETLVINGETFSIDMAPVVTFSSGTSLAEFYQDPNATSTFTVDGQTYLLNDGTRVVPAGVISINLLADQPAGATLDSLTAADIARTVAEAFESQVDLNRILPSGTEIEQFYDANPIPIGADPDEYYADNPDKLFTVYLNGTEFVLLDGDTQRSDLTLGFNNDLFAFRRQVDVFEFFQFLSVDGTDATSLDDLSADDVAFVIGTLIGETDFAVDYDQLVPSAAILDNFYADADASFVVTIDDVGYVLNDGLRTVGVNQVSVPLGTDVTQADIAGELQSVVESNTGVQTPSYASIDQFDFSDPSDPTDPFGNTNPAGELGRNDLTYQATPISYSGGNLVVNGRGTLGTITPSLITNRGDIDMVSIDNVLAGTTISVSVTSDQPGVENNIRFFDEDGIELLAAGGGLLAVENISDGTVSVVVPSDGLYFIGISGPENSTYDPRISGTADAAQTGGYAASVVIQTDMNITASGASVEFNGAGLVSVGTAEVTDGAADGLAVSNQSELVGTPIRVNRDDTAADVAVALQSAVAERFADGNTDLIPVAGTAVRLPNLNIDTDLLGPFVSTAQRYGDQFGGDYQAGASDNAFEGAYIDDIIIGFAERGEMVTSATPIDADEAFVDSGELSLTSPSETSRPTQSGSYQLEIRDASEYIASGAVLEVAPNLVDARFRAFDTNDRLVSSSVSLTTKSASEILDGSTFTIAGANNRVTFEFDVLDAAGNSNGFAQNANRVLVQVAADATAEEVADTIISRINSQQVSTLLGVTATRGNLTRINTSDSVPDSRINLSGASSIRTNAIGATAFESTSTDDLRGDTNRDNVEQGVIMIENSRFIYNEDAGLQISRDAEESVISNEETDSTPSLVTYARNFLELNTENLVPGVVVRNNTFAFNEEVGIDISGLENGGLASQNPVGFDRILNNTLMGGTIEQTVGLGSQIFESIFFPLGAISFADSVVDSETVFGPDVEASFTDSEAALGSPDCYGVSDTDPENGLFTFSLGSGGSAVFAFDDNLLTGSSSNPDAVMGVGDGIDDLVIFETGIPERVRVEISRDGTTYFNVGEIFGLDNTIDLDAFGFGLSDRFSYVRLTDLSPSGTNNFGPGGADIDAVGAISTVPRDQFVAGQTGIQIADNSAPTLLNNVVSNFDVGVSVSPTPDAGSGLVDVSADLTVIGGTTYYRNTLASAIAGVEGFGQSAQFIDSSESVFVDPLNLIFTPQSRTPIIDSGIASLEDRASLISLRNSLGLPSSPIFAPTFDANGQLRVDDPTFDTSFGVGLSGFVDRGAEERTDNEGPRFVLSSPRGQDLIFDQTRELFGRSITQGTIFDAFEIQLIDGIIPADTGNGVGVNDSTVTSENILVTRLVVGSTEVELLEEGQDYTFSYEPADNMIRITPIAGIWADNAVYTVEFLGTELGSADGFNAVLKAESGTEYADGEKTFIDGQILETELGIQLSVLASELTEVNELTGLTSSVLGGQTITVFDGINSEVTFEFVTDITEEVVNGIVTSSGNYAISLPSTATAQRVALLLTNAINELVQSQPNVLNIEAVYLEDDGTSTTGRMQLLGTHATSNLAYVSFDDDSIFRQVNQELDVQLLPDITIDTDGTRLSNYDETIVVFDGTREVAFEFDSDGIIDAVDPNVDRVVLPVAVDASLRELVQALLQGFQDEGLDLQASGASGVFRVRGTDGPISVSAESGGASVTGNSDIGVSLGFGLQIPTIADEMSDAVQDGQTFTIASGLATPVTFEIDFDGTTSTTGAIPVTVFGGGFGGSPDALANAIVSAVSAQFPSLTPINHGGGTITLGGDEDIRLNTAGTVIEQVGSPGDPASQAVVIRYNDDSNTVAEAFGDAALAAGLGGVDGTDVEQIDNRVLLKTETTPRGDAVVTEFIADEAGNRLQPASEQVGSRVEILVGQLSDYGDASLTFGNGENYPTTIQTGGPSHTIVDNDDDALFLGSSVTADVNGTNDDLDIDDGVIQLGTLQPGFSSDFEVSINQRQGAPSPSSTSYLDVWFDWDGDGVFEEAAGEVDRYTFAANTPFLVNTLTVDVPSTAQLGDVQARFRLSYEADLGPLGATNAGEVEDYVFTVINNPFTGTTVVEDVNDSGAVTPLDALLIINVINANDGSVDLDNVPAGITLPKYPDVNGDGMVSAVDALRVINYLNANNRPGEVVPGSEPLGNTSTQSVAYSPVADGVLATNSTIQFDPTVAPATTTTTATPSGEPLPVAGESPSLDESLSESAKTSVFDSAATIGLDGIVDALAQDRQDAQSSQSDDENSALDDFFAELG